MPYVNVNSTSRLIVGGPFAVEADATADLAASGETTVNIATANWNADAEPNTNWYVTTGGVLQRGPIADDDSKKAAWLERAQNAVNRMLANTDLAWVHDALGQTSVQATRSWAWQAGAAAIYVINHATWTDTKKEAAIAQLESISSASTVETWYGVMRGDETKRNGWRGFSVAAGSAVYVDWLDAAGDVRTVDGSHQVILTGATIPTGYNVRRLSLT